VRMIHKRFFWAPSLSDPEQTATARWLTLFLLILAAVILLMGFIVPALANPALLQFTFVLTNLASLAVIGGALILVHYGYVRLAAAFAVFCLFAAVT
jgi:hypothetical protein